ncbi:glycoside hydrolase family 61 protein [Rhizoctonia solani]|uniref:lytic cellulose monooxygenase (C4-dehydrogenating) n=1 Tax=Rhizoctonia solani TaxID=456999 RepID=A0A8H8SZR5_9AGAM|nr:glycoside hydrolase family 61 protein [Rhizoctonia solani]QRW23894.1 glycoside hydrolase family 61 protein [Rhizoctonia solani]
MLALPALLLAAATSVLGHGFVQEIVASSGTYTGYLPYNDPYTTPAPQRSIRKIPGNGPIEDVTSMDIQCNGGAVPAPAIIKVAAGSNVALNWTTWPDSHIGPLITYMARAPSDITKWSPGTSAVWFKIDESGLSNGKWAATDILTENKSIYTFKVPASLKAGQYLIRHEIIALHSASTQGGAQFYPSCIQVEITGSGTETGPSTCRIPRSVQVDRPRRCHFLPDPRPAVWTGGSSSGNAPTPVTTVPTTAPAATTTARPTTQAPANYASSGPAGSVAQYGQCGGLSYTGATRLNDYYYQCL